MYQVLPPLSPTSLVSSLCRLSIAAGFAYLLLLAPLAAQEEKDNSPPGRQNPILRDYFRKQYDEFHTSPHERVPPTFVDSFIDLQIDHLLSKVEEKLSRLNANVETLEQARSRWLDTPADRRAQVTRIFKQTLRLIEDDAGDLRKTLSLIFIELKEKAASNPQIDPSTEDFYLTEVRFLSETIRVAEKRIRDYLFATDTTVDVSVLRDKNMLMLLDEARIVARRVQKRL